MGPIRRSTMRVTFGSGGTTADGGQPRSRSRAGDRIGGQATTTVVTVGRPNRGGFAARTDGDAPLPMSRASPSPASRQRPTPATTRSSGSRTWTRTTAPRGQTSPAPVPTRARCHGPSRAAVGPRRPRGPRGSPANSPLNHPTRRRESIERITPTVPTVNGIVDADVGADADPDGTRPRAANRNPNHR
jgi:hypothetical protein